MIEKNRCSLIIRNVDTESKEFKKFEKYYSLENKIAKKYKYEGCKKYEYSIFETVNNTVYMPASVSTTIVQSYFVNKNITEDYSTIPKAKEIDIAMIHNPKDDLQQQALDFLKEVVNDNKDHNRMLNLATGSGKTFVSIAFISFMKLRSLIIVDTIDLASQWKREILFHTNIQEDEILILSGKETIEEAKNNSNYKIFIGIHKTFNMLLSEDYNSINDLMFKLNIGIRIFDECHVNFKNICMINSFSNVNYTLYLTATPERSEFASDVLYKKVFGKIKSFTKISTVNEKYHTVIMGEFNSNPTDKQKLSVHTKYGFSLSKWGSILLDYKYDKFFTVLTELIEKFKLIENNKKFAIILPLNELINVTATKLKETYPDIDIGEFIGTSKASDRDDALKKKIIVTNEKMFGKAIDVSDLDCLINFNQYKSQVNLKQILGRLRNNPGHSHILIDITDSGYKECRQQKRTRKKIYENIETVKKIYEINEKLGE